MADAEPNIVRVGTILCGFVVTIMAVVNYGMFDVQSISLPHATYETATISNADATAVGQPWRESSVTYTISWFAHQKDGPHSMGKDAGQTFPPEQHTPQSMQALYSFQPHSNLQYDEMILSTASFSVLFAAVGTVLLTIPTMTYKTAHIIYIFSGLALIANWVQSQRITESYKQRDELVIPTQDTDGTDRAVNLATSGTATMDPTIPLVIGIVCGLTLLIHPYMRVRKGGYSALVPDRSTFSVEGKF